MIYILAIGSSGLGKSTFINTLCNKSIVQRKISTASEAALEKTSVIDPKSVGTEYFKIYVELDEQGLKLSLSIIDTPGFGESFDNEGSISAVMKYVEKQYDEILSEESRIKRNPKFQGNIKFNIQIIECTLSFTLLILTVTGIGNTHFLV